MIDAGLQLQIEAGLRRISAHDLQIMAEEIAILKFPERFRTGTFVRSGRNVEEQTTKNWPDAYVLTAGATVDGVEATRDKINWAKHLSEDLAKARDPNRPNLSGYLFVGGYPHASPSPTELKDWIEAFATLGLPPERVTILVGLALVAELMDPMYAQIRLRFLGVSDAPGGFRSIAASHSGNLDFRPSREDFDNGYVGAPRLLDTVLDRLEADGICLVRGLGAAGKTTLGQLVGHSHRIAPSPTWILDLTDTDIVEAAALDGMTRWAGRDVVFIIDNAHLNEAAALRLIQHWRDTARHLGARLLVLARRTRFNGETDLGGLQPLDLRAGVAEMEAVVARLWRRNGKWPPAIPPEQLAEWAVAFGGSKDPATVAVDLIAFSAAVANRSKAFDEGDFRLDAEAAVDEVHRRYLQPLGQGSERSSLLRLAALAAHEIPAPADIFDGPNPLEVAINRLGIVLADQTGLEGRTVYRLVHHALGRLLLSATTDFNPATELATVAGLNPALGLRMIRASQKSLDGEPEPGNDTTRIEDAITTSLRSASWMPTVRAPNDLASIVRHAVKTSAVHPADLDEALLGEKWLHGRLNRIRALRSVVALTRSLDESGLQRSKTAVAVLAADPRSNLHQTVLVAPLADGVALFKLFPDDGRPLASIDAAVWDARQAHVPPDEVDRVVSAARYVAQRGRYDLAVTPCRRAIQACDPTLFAGADLGHLSHLLRIGAPEPAEAELLLNALSDSGWLDRALTRSRLGPLCGGLMSIANHGAAAHRHLLVRPALSDRITRELGAEFWIDHIQEEVDAEFSRIGLETAVRPQDHGGRRWLADKHLSRPVCLLGAYLAVGGEVAVPSIDWSPPLLDRMMAGFRAEHSPTFFGMYELQFWLGQMSLAKHGNAPLAVSPKDGERFTAALQTSDAPTMHAGNLKRVLLEWLARCRAAGWSLVP